MTTRINGRVVAEAALVDALLEAIEPPPGYRIRDESEPAKRTDRVWFNGVWHTPSEILRQDVVEGDVLLFATPIERAGLEPGRRFVGKDEPPRDGDRVEYTSGTTRITSRVMTEKERRSLRRQETE